MLRSDHTPNNAHDPYGLLGRVGQAAIDGLSTPVAVVRTDGRIVAVNRAWTTFGSENGGDSGNTGLGVNYLAVCEAAPRAGETDSMASGLRDVLSGHRTEFYFDYPCHSPQELRWFRAHVTPCLAPDGGVDYAIVVHEDVTTRRLAEQRLDELDREVAYEVGQRTRALSEANDELDAFAASVSHDLRAPVRHITGFLGLLSRRLGDGRLDDGDQRLLAMLEAASLRLGSMIDEMLNLSRISRADLRLRDVNVGALIQEVWASLAPEREGRDLTLHLHDLPPVQADDGLLRLAFENLLGNAVKYTRQSAHGEVHVGSVVGADEIVLWVRDNGVGFDARHADRLFRAFQRLHRDDEFEGVGMGLINVRRVATKHGGRVWAESRAGHGATFYLAFPRVG